MQYVSLERICDHVTIARYHPDGGGYGSPYTFVTTVAFVEGEWWFKAGLGTYTKKTSRSIKLALKEAGFPTMRRERFGHGNSRTLLINIPHQK